MSYKYILKYKKGSEQKIVVEAWPRLREYATEKERRRPSFTIGSVEGSKTIMLWHYIEQSKRKYSATARSGHYTKIVYPPEDMDAISDAYRTGLAAAVIQAADDADCAEVALRYILHATKEEIWFWTSKLLGVIGEKTDRNKVLTAIYVLSGAKRP